MRRGVTNSKINMKGIGSGSEHSSVKVRRWYLVRAKMRWTWGRVGRFQDFISIICIYIYIYMYTYIYIRVRLFYVFVYNILLPKWPFVMFRHSSCKILNNCIKGCELCFVYTPKENICLQHILSHIVHANKIQNRINNAIEEYLLWTES